MVHFKSIILFVFFLLVYKTTIEFSYINFVFKYFNYTGFNYAFDLSRYFLSTIIILFLVPVLPIVFKKISDFFLTLFYFVSLVPIASMYGLDSNLSIVPLMINTLSFLIIYFIIKIKQFKVVKVSRVRKGEFLFIFINIVMVLYLLFWYSYTGAISNLNFDFAKVYEFREVNSELTNIGFASYMNNWVYKLSCLAIMGYGFLKKNYIIVFFSFLIQVLFFGVSAHKSVLFSGIMILGVYFYLKNIKTLLVIPFFLSVFSLFFLVISLYEEYQMYSSIFIRRLIFLPAKLNYDYVEFFQSNNFSWWSTSILSSVINTPYPLGIDRAIGDYLGTPNANMNNGFVSSGYAQAGILGVIVYSAILGWLLKFIDYLSNCSIYPLWFSLIIVINPLISALLSSDLFTSLLTHGLTLAIIFLVLINNQIVYAKD